MSIAFNDVWKSASGNGMKKVCTFGAARREADIAQKTEARAWIGRVAETERGVMASGWDSGRSRTISGLLALRDF